MGVPDPLGEGEMWVEPRSQNMKLQIASATRQIETSDSAFCQISLVLVNSAIEITLLTTETRESVFCPLSPCV